MNWVMAVGIRWQRHFSLSQTSFRLSTGQTITIYKATQKGKGARLVEQGFHPADFPCHPPNADGKCYFAAPNNRSLAEEYYRYYKDGILEVTIESEVYDRNFKPLERSYQGGEQVELPIPHDLFPILNQCPRVLKPR
jgi:hypothetical protein